MRKLILFAALAAAVAPTTAIAQQRGWHHDRGDRHDRDYRHGRSDRYDRHDRHDRNRKYRHHSAYAAPYRHWNYRPVTVGFRLRPVFYGPRYYISDYGAYDLRAPGRWQRWIRYGNDLLLVNIRTGRVLDVIHYRYW